MTDSSSVGGDLSAGTYRCTTCGHRVQVGSVEFLPPCPACEGPQFWEATSVGDRSDFSSLANRLPLDESLAP